MSLLLDKMLQQLGDDTFLRWELLLHQLVQTVNNLLS